MTPLALDTYPQPESNDADTVDAALAALRAAKDEASANEAYDAFLWSVGNNHTGTFYPVVLGVLPELERILAGGGAWAQRAVIESLIDLGGSFIPEAGHERHQGASVQEQLVAFVQSLRPLVAPLARGDDARARSAAELLELIDDRAA